MPLSMPRVLALAATALIAGPAAAAHASPLAGDLDPAFATNGVSITAIGPTRIFSNGKRNAEIDGDTLLADGKIMAVGATGQTTLPGGALAIAALRYNADGSPDTTFDDDGAEYLASIGDSSDAAAVTEIGGKVYVAGDTYTGSTYSVFVARLTDSGALDTTFGSGGYVKITAPSPAGTYIAAEGITAGPSGTILVSAFLSGKIGLIKLNADGSPFAGFGTGGLVTTTAASMAGSIGQGVAAVGDKILVAGSASDGTTEHFYTARFTATGAADTTYGTSGVTTIAATAGLDTNEYGFSVDNQGRALLGGTVGASSSTSVPVAVRVLASGTLDTSFGTGGVVTLPAPVTYLRTFADTPDGKIAFGGGGTKNGIAALVTGRMLSNGTLDTSFSGDGLAYFTTPSSAGSSGQVLTTSSGAILNFGSAEDDGPLGALAVRYLGTDAPAPGPGPDDSQMLPITSPGPLPGVPVPAATSPLTGVSVLSPKFGSLEKGKLKLVATCSRACKVSITLTVTSKDAVKDKLSKKKKTFTLASASGQLRGAGSLTLTLKSSKKLAAALAKLKHLNATASVVTTDGATGASSTATHAVTLKK
jgi:uncharacterized delta-60 repeat protein